MQNHYNHITKLVLIPKIYFKVYTCLTFLTFWICIKGNQVYYTWITYIPFLSVCNQPLFFHCVKYAKIRAFSNPYFPVCGQNNIRGKIQIRVCPYTGKYGSEKVRISSYSCSALLNIFSHNLDLRENISFVSGQKLFVREYMNCLTARK